MPECAALAVAALRQHGRLRLRVWGASMLPTLWPGDRVEIESCALSAARPGQIVLAIRGARFYLHRLVAVNSSGGFVVRGDAMPGADPPFASCSFMGRVVRVERSGRTAAMSSWLRVHARLVGLLFCYSGWARRIALRLRRPAIAEVGNQIAEVGGYDSANSADPERLHFCNLTSDLCNIEAP